MHAPARRGPSCASSRPTRIIQPAIIGAARAIVEFQPEPAGRPDRHRRLLRCGRIPAGGHGPADSAPCPRSSAKGMPWHSHQGCSRKRTSCQQEAQRSLWRATRHAQATHRRKQPIDRSRSRPGKNLSDPSHCGLHRDMSGNRPHRTDRPDRDGCLMIQLELKAPQWRS